MAESALQGKEQARPLVHCGDLEDLHTVFTATLSLPRIDQLYMMKDKILQRIDLFYRDWGNLKNSADLCAYLLAVVPGDTDLNSQIRDIHEKIVEIAPDVTLDDLLPTRCIHAAARHVLEEIDYSLFMTQGHLGVEDPFVYQDLMNPLVLYIAGLTVKANHLYQEEAVRRGVIEESSAVNGWMPHFRKSMEKAQKALFESGITENRLPLELVTWAEGYVDRFKESLPSMEISDTTEATKQWRRRTSPLSNAGFGFTARQLRYHFLEDKG